MGYKGVILASWSGCENDENDEISFDIEKVLRDHFPNAPYPVILGFPSGPYRYSSDPSSKL